MSNNATSTLVLKLCAAVVGMFAFGFALVPLYDVFCEVAGLNGKTSNEAYQAVEVKIDESRTITVQFVAQNNDGMTWAFEPSDRMVKVHPGAATNTTFYAKNPSSKKMVAQAIPSVSPGRAAEYFHKTECFCFNQQTLAGGEEIDMPLQFIVDQDLPKDINTITLSYTIFDVTPEEVAAH
jgi:cytochrome c oxidase assembly protein subunit 11